MSDRLLAFTSTCLLLVACGPTEEPARPPAGEAGPPAVEAPIVEVRTSDVPVRLEVTGRVVAVSQATLSSQVQAAVQELKVREGATVTQGQPLVVLDSRDLRADLARAEAEAENAKAHLVRMQHLFDQESIAKQELENATRAYKVADAGRRASLTRLSYTTIKAPFDGIITERLVEVGELASPGQALLRMEDPRRLRLEATVAEQDLKAVSLGDRLPVRVDALGPMSLEGTVVKIKVAGDPGTHTFEVKVDLPPTPGLKSGMFGRMVLDKGVMRTILIPKAALLERGELTGVYAVGTDGVAHLRWIKIGRTMEQGVEVLSGLNVGEHVLAEAARGIEGAQVRPTEAVAAPAPAP